MATFNTKLIVTLVIVVVCLLFAFYSNEARKEVYFLCGNFHQGTSIESVERQLATSTLSSYQTEFSEQGKRVVHSSWLNFHLFSCNIEFNQEDKVKLASYTFALTVSAN